MDRKTLSEPLKGTVSLQFIGAAGVVTGSKHLLRTPETNVLIDCGLFQGLRNLRQLNRDPLPVDPALIRSVIITHAHLDHTGYLPVLVRNGFSGKFFMTAPTRALAEIILMDSAKLQEEDADHANRMGYSKHKPALPLYTQQEVKKTFEQMQVCQDEEWIELSPNLKFRYRKNGHILGSAFVEMDCFEKRLVFSGDLGRQDSFSLAPPLTPEKADILVVESTYGDRLHPVTGTETELAEVILETLHKKGNLLIPSFAVGRAQDLMLVINNLKKKNFIPDIPVYLDSPMATGATKVYEQYPEWHKLSAGQCSEMCHNIHYVKDLKETYQVIDKPGPKIVIAASGMLTGGRVLHYLKSYLGHKQHTILLVGYQAAGTRGRSLRSNVHELKLFGSYFPVKAEVREISSLSAHADQQELINWMRAIQNRPERVFIVHGEPEASYALELKIHDVLGWNAVAPLLNERYELVVPAGQENPVVKEASPVAVQNP